MKVRTLLVGTAIASSILGAVVAYLVLTVPNDLQADALLKAARKEIRAGENDRARRSLSLIVQEYPRTDAAAAATLTQGDATFDVVVVPHELSARPTEVSHIASEAARVARPGGRVVIIEDTERTGFRRLLSRDTRRLLSTDEIRTLLSDAGLRASRVLAEVDGVAYIDAVKPRS